MKNILDEIVGNLQGSRYLNEEHVRVAVVCRLLQGLGWDIWNPAELIPEHVSTPQEDGTRVDLALMKPPARRVPGIFIEVKAPGKLLPSLGQAEMQLRDYNRNNQSEISVLTDGRHWYFYLPSAPGEFKNKRFEEIDFLREERDDVELSLDAFLSRKALQDGTAIEEARRHLRRTDDERTMFDVVPLARREVAGNDGVALVDTFIRLCSERGVDCDRGKGLLFLQNNRQRLDNEFKAQSSHTRPSGSVNAKSGSFSDGKGVIGGQSASTGTLRLIGSRGADATGRLTEGKKLLVLAGSIAQKVTSGFAEDNGSSYKTRLKLEREGVLMPELTGDLYRLVKDYEFSSWSAAASVMVGSSESGPRAWK